MWWLEGEVAPGWGLRGHWIAAGAWACWLLFLCVHQTGDGMYFTLFTVLQSFDAWPRGDKFVNLPYGSFSNFLLSGKFPSLQAPDTAFHLNFRCTAEEMGWLSVGSCHMMA